MPDTDPNQVRLTGENSFIRLLDAAEGPQLTRVSHWRILYSPAGPGHALFIQSDVTGGAVRIYADNEAMTRWLQEEIESLLYPPFADAGLPVGRRDVRQRGRHPDGLDGDGQERRGRRLVDLVGPRRAVRPDPRRRERPRAPPRGLQLLHPGPRRAGGAQRPRRGGAPLPAAAGRAGRQHRLPGPLRDVGAPVAPHAPHAPPPLTPLRPRRGPPGSRLRAAAGRRAG